jgi:hypothetical protein
LSPGAAHFAGAALVDVWPPGPRVEFTRPEVARGLLEAAKEEVTAPGVPANSRRSLGVRGAP